MAFFVTEYRFVKGHGSFDSQEEAEQWISGQPEPEDKATVFRVDEESGEDDWWEFRGRW